MTFVPWSRPLLFAKYVLWMLVLGEEWETGDQR